ncbi:MAG: hypothetical protein JWR80_6171 [Bradyrhizobium sp.]|nr:hypothetical protein [Bradyrhizobium sp.]
MSRTRVGNIVNQCPRYAVMSAGTSGDVGKRDS